MDLTQLKLLFSQDYFRSRPEALDSICMLAGRSGAISNLIDGRSHLNNRGYSIAQHTSW